MAVPSSQSHGYLMHAWKLLTQDKGWVKVILLLALCQFVPIVGQIALLGYLLEWARLVAWGAEAAPKQQGVQVGTVLKVGFRALVVSIVWVIVMGIASTVITGLFAMILRPLLGLVTLLLNIATIVVGLVVMVAQLRSAIYQNISSGLQPAPILKMSAHDPWGLVYVFAIQLLGTILASGVAFLAGIFILFIGITELSSAFGMWWGGSLLDSFSYIDPYFIGSALNNLLTSSLALLGILFYLLAVISVATLLVSGVALALWMRQFKVESWGSQHDPVPGLDAPTPAGDAASAAPPANVWPPAGYTDLATPVIVDEDAQPPAQSGYQTSTDANKEVAPMTETDTPQVTPPTNKEIYVDAAHETTAWTSVVDPDRNATDHLEYHDQPTEPPAPADPHGVTPPTQEDAYKNAPEQVAAWPTEALDDAATAADEKLSGEDLSHTDVAQTPVEAPSQADIYGTASRETAEWVSAENPMPEATDHLDYEPAPTVAPKPASDNGVTPPSDNDIYVEAADQVTAWPEFENDAPLAAEQELIEDNIAHADPASGPVVDAADGNAVPAYLSPADASGTEPDPIKGGE